MQPPNQNPANNNDEETAPLLGTAIVQGHTSLSWQRISALGFSYSSYLLAIFYNVVLFNAVHDTLSNTSAEIIGDDDQTSLSFEIIISIALGFLCLSDVTINLLAIQPSEMAFELLQHESNQGDNLTDYPYQDLNESSSWQKQFIKNSLYATRLITYSSFFAGASSSILAVAQLGASEATTIVVGGAMTLLGVNFFHMLFSKDITLHHFWIYSEVFEKFKNCKKVILKNPAASLEITLQVLSNAFYQGTTWAYFVGKLTNNKDAIIPQGKLLLIGYAFVSSAFSVFFTRLIESQKYYLKNIEPPTLKNLIFNPKQYLAKKKAIQVLTFSTLRSIGIGYTFGRFTPISLAAKLAIGSTATIFFILHGAVVAAQQGTKTESFTDIDDHTTSRFDRSFATTTVLLARILRVFGIVEFMGTLSGILHDNNVEIGLTLFDAYMISLAAISIEASNYFFYKEKVKFGIKYLRQKYQLERQQVNLPGENKFSLKRFLLFSVKDYSHDDPTVEPMEQFSPT